MEALCKKIVLIIEGQKEFEGSIDQFKNKFHKEKTIVFDFEKPIAHFPEKWTKKFHCDWNPDKNQVKVRVPEKDLKSVTIEILNQFPVSDFHTEKVSVEEVMSEILSYSQSHSAPQNH